LSVFVGGGTLAAAEAVCAAEGAERGWVLDLLSRLVDHSLVNPEEPGGEPRYTMLETIREYALERLEASGEAEAARRRHAAFFLALAQRAAPQWRGSERLVWLTRMKAEHDNLRAALAWWAGCGDAESGLRLALEQFWIAQGHIGEGRRWLDELLAFERTSPPVLQAQALDYTGLFARWQGDYARARACHEASLALWEEVADQRAVASARESLGMDLWAAGDTDRAVAPFEGNLARCRDAGDTHGMVRSLRDLGLVALAQADHVRAQGQFEASVSLARRSGDQFYVARGLADLGQVAYEQEAYGAAAEFFTEGLVLLQRLGARHQVADCVSGLAAIAGAGGQPERAARLLAAAAALRLATGLVRYAPERAAQERAVNAMRTQLGGPAFEAAQDEGRAMTLEEAIAYALERGAAPSPPPAPDASRATAAAALPARNRLATTELSPRQREVAALVAQDLSNREIAARLVVTERTAENHVANIMSKLGCRSRAAIATWATERGLRAGRMDGTGPTVAASPDSGAAVTRPTR
jgi:non-specific serine/threonine protein kinase